MARNLCGETIPPRLDGWFSVDSWLGSIRLTFSGKIFWPLRLGLAGLNLYDVGYSLVDTDLFDAGPEMRGNLTKPPCHRHLVTG